MKNKGVTATGSVLISISREDARAHSFKSHDKSGLYVPSVTCDLTRLESEPVMMTAVSHSDESPSADKTDVLLIFNPATANKCC